MRYKLIAVIGSVLLLAVCSIVTAGNAGGKNWKQGGADAIAPLSFDEEAGLVFMREEEKLARDLYSIFADEWGLAIFVNISSSEQKHMDQVKKLLDIYGVTDPVPSGFSTGRFSNPDLQYLFTELVLMGASMGATVEEALKAGVIVEEKDIRDLQERIAVTSHSDIISTYQSLMCGSRNHLRAFVKQMELRGSGIYSAEILSEEEFDDIVHSRTERCGRRR